MFTLTALYLYTLLGPVGAQIVKEPLVKDAIRGFTDDFESILPGPQKYTTVKWSADNVVRGVPTDGAWSESLVHEGGQQYCGEDLSVYNITYEDCPDPWLIGHCSKAARDLNTTINLLGSLPSNFRAGISDFLHAYLPDGLGYIGGGGSSGVIAGKFRPGDAIEIAVRAAIFGKGVDANAFADAVDADTCVADETSANDLNRPGVSYGAAVYRAGMIVAYEKMVKKLPVDTSCMKNQMEIIAPLINDRLDAKGECPNKAVPVLESLNSILFPDGIEVLNETPVPDAGKPIIYAWEPGSYPEFCWNEARVNKKGLDEARCAPEDLSVYNVTYPDCPDKDPWAVCHCSDAQVSFDQMVTSFGRLPPALRSHVTHIMALNGIEGDGKVHTWAGTVIPPRGILFFGDCPDSVFMHEGAHCIDRDFHDDPLFTDAKANDSCVPTNYAKTSDTELFAEVSAAFVYDRNSKSLEERGFDPSCMANQMQAVDEYVGKDYTLPTSECFRREPDTPIVTPSQFRLAGVEPYISKVVREDFEPARRMNTLAARGPVNYDLPGYENIRWL